MTAVVLVALLLAEAYTLTSSGDGGWDLEVSLDLPGSRERSIVECKRWKRHRVGVQIVRQLAGAWRSAGATKRILVTTSTFTRPARKEAAAQPQLGPPGCDASRLRSI
ncbi:MAG TPA: restriction endonuclease [Baekduia sp.]